MLRIGAQILSNVLESWKREVDHICLSFAQRPESTTTAHSMSSESGTGVGGSGGISSGGTGGMSLSSSSSSSSSSASSSLPMSLILQVSEEQRSAEEYLACGISASLLRYVSAMSAVSRHPNWVNVILDSIFACPKPLIPESLSQNIASSHSTNPHNLNHAQVARIMANRAQDMFNLVCMRTISAVLSGLAIPHCSTELSDRVVAHCMAHMDLDDASRCVGSLANSSSAQFAKIANKYLIELTLKKPTFIYALRYLQVARLEDSAVSEFLSKLHIHFASAKKMDLKHLYCESLVALFGSVQGPITNDAHKEYLMPYVVKAEKWNKKSKHQQATVPLLIVLYSLLGNRQRDVFTLCMTAKRVFSDVVLSLDEMNQLSRVLPITKENVFYFASHQLDFAIMKVILPSMHLEVALSALYDLLTTKAADMKSYCPPLHKQLLSMLTARQQVSLALRISRLMLPVYRIPSPLIVSLMEYCNGSPTLREDIWAYIDVLPNPPLDLVFFCLSSKDVELVFRCLHVVKKCIGDISEAQVQQLEACAVILLCDSNIRMRIAALTILDNLVSENLLSSNPDSASSGTAGNGTDFETDGCSASMDSTTTTSTTGTAVSPTSAASTQGTFSSVRVTHILHEFIPNIHQISLADHAGNDEWKQTLAKMGSLLREYTPAVSQYILKYIDLHKMLHVEKSTDLEQWERLSVLVCCFNQLRDVLLSAPTIRYALFPLGCLRSESLMRQTIDAVSALKTTSRIRKYYLSKLYASWVAGCFAEREAHIKSVLEVGKYFSDIAIREGMVQTVLKLAQAHLSQVYSFESRFTFLSFLIDNFTASFGPTPSFSFESNPDAAISVCVMTDSSSRKVALDEKMYRAFQLSCHRLTKSAMISLCECGPVHDGVLEKKVIAYAEQQLSSLEDRRSLLSVFLQHNRSWIPHAVNQVYKPISPAQFATVDQTLQYAYYEALVHVFAADRRPHAEEAPVDMPVICLALYAIARFGDGKLFHRSTSDMVQTAGSLDFSHIETAIQCCRTVAVSEKYDRLDILKEFVSRLSTESLDFVTPILSEWVSKFPLHSKTSKDVLKLLFFDVSVCFPSTVSNVWVSLCSRPDWIPFTLNYFLHINFEELDPLSIDMVKRIVAIISLLDVPAVLSCVVNAMDEFHVSSIVVSSEILFLLPVHALAPYLPTIASFCLLSLQNAPMWSLKYLYLCMQHLLFTCSVKPLEAYISFHPDSFEAVEQLDRSKTLIHHLQAMALAVPSPNTSSASASTFTFTSNPASASPLSGSATATLSSSPSPKGIAALTLVEWTAEICELVKDVDQFAAAVCDKSLVWAVACAASEVRRQQSFVPVCLSIYRGTISKSAVNPSVGQLHKLIELGSAISEATMLLEVMSALTSFMESLRESNYLLFPQLWWMIVGLLYSPDEKIYASALRLCEKYFYAVDFASDTVQTVLSAALPPSLSMTGNSADSAMQFFDGLAPLLLRGTISHHCEETSYKLLIHALSSHCYSILDPSQRYFGQLIVVLLPYICSKLFATTSFASQLSSVKSGQASSGFVIAGDAPLSPRITSRQRGQSVTRLQSTNGKLSSVIAPTHEPTFTPDTMERVSTILTAEDEKVRRTRISFLLKEEGVEDVTTGIRGSEALGVFCESLGESRLSKVFAKVSKLTYAKEDLFFSDLRKPLIVLLESEALKQRERRNSLEKDVSQVANDPLALWHVGSATLNNLLDILCRILGHGNASLRPHVFGLLRMFMLSVDLDKVTRADSFIDVTSSFLRGAFQQDAELVLDAAAHNLSRKLSAQQFTEAAAKIKERMGLPSQSQSQSQSQSKAHLSARDPSFFSSSASSSSSSSSSSSVSLAEDGSSSDHLAAGIQDSTQDQAQNGSGHAVAVDPEAVRSTVHAPSRHLLILKELLASTL
eukprot:ANDGO_07995.mRNA.1 hypothetical protein